MTAIAQRNQQKINEKRLFHGTSPETVEPICKQNFDWRLHGKNATRFGEGSYFAVNASYSHAYANRDASLSQSMFLAKVLVGSYTKGHPSYRRPPLKQPSNPASDLYDSCVDNQTNPTIFVVFDTDQFYPEYIIKYVFHTTSDYSSPQPKPAPRRRSSLHTTAPSPSRSAVGSGYSSTTSNSGLTIGNPPPISSNNLGTGSNPSKTAVDRGSSTAPQTTSAYNGWPQPRTVPLPKPPSSQTYPYGILKHQPSSSNNLGAASTPSASAAQSGYSASTASRPGLTSTNPTKSLNNPGAASTPSETTSQSSNSASTASRQGLTSVNPARSLNNPGTASTPSRTTSQSSNSASTASRQGLTSANPTRSLNNPGTASTLSGTAAQSSYSNSPVSSSGLSSANPARSSLGAASNPSGSVTRSGYSSNVFSSTRCAYNTSGSFTHVLRPTSPYSPTSGHGLRTATTDTNEKRAKKKKKDCIIS